MCVPSYPSSLLNLLTFLLTPTSPNILALNFFSLLEQKILFLAVFSVIALALTYLFHRWTRTIIYGDQTTNTEGLLRVTKKTSGWGLVLITFVLCVLYLPVSTIAVHGLVRAFRITSLSFGKASELNFFRTGMVI